MLMWILGVGGSKEPKEVLGDRDTTRRIPFEEFERIMVQFSGSVNLHKAVQRLRRYRNVFDKLKEGRTGNVSIYEFRAAILALDRSLDNVSQMLALIDRDGSGTISWLEFALFCHATTTGDPDSASRRALLRDLSKRLSKGFLAEELKLMQKDIDEAHAELTCLERLGVWRLERIHQPRSDNNGCYDRFRTFCRRRLGGQELPPASTRAGPDLCGEAAAAAADLEALQELPEPTAVSQCSSGILSAASKASIHSRTSDLCEDRKFHVLTNEMRLCLRALLRLTIAKGVFAGVLAAVLTSVAQLFVERQYGVIGLQWQQDTRSMVMFYLITLSIGCALSVVELACIYYSCLDAAIKMTAVCGLELWPACRESCLIIGALARASFGIPHPAGMRMGIDPSKRMSKGKLLVFSLVYLGKRSLTKFVLKSAVNRVLPRLGIKSISGEVGFGLGDLLISALVNALWNFVTVRHCMREARICCTGPSAAVEAINRVCMAYETSAPEGTPRLQAIDDHAKATALRALGNIVITKQAFHPNLRHMLQVLALLWVDDEFLDRQVTRAPTAPCCAETPVIQACYKSGRCCLKLKLPNQREPQHQRRMTNERLEKLQLDDHDEFIKGLPELTAREVDLVFSLAAVGLIIDGRATLKLFNWLRACLQLCEPPREPSWKSFLHLQRVFMSGMPLTPEDIQAVINHPDRETWRDVFAWRLRRWLKCDCCDMFKANLATLTFNPDRG